MYGYVRTYAPELRLREQDVYRAVYCGLCRRQGQYAGQVSRLSLSYDMTFMVIMRMALTGEPLTLKNGRCPVHPIRRRLFAVGPARESSAPAEDDALTLCAAASVILAYHKVMDDREDERGRRRLRADVLRPLVAGPRRRVLRKRRQTPGEALPIPAEIDALVTDGLRALHDVESARPASADEPAACFGGLMARLLSYGLEETSPAARVASVIGLHVGRWVYLLDAADDYAEDRRLGRYNPFVCLWGGAEEELTEARRREISAALAEERDAIARALDLITVSDRDLNGIIRNVLTEGMPRTVRSVLEREDSGKGRRKQTKKTKGKSIE